MIKYTIALPSTTNSTNSNASDLNSVSFNPQNNHHIDAKLPKLEINQLSDKFLGSILAAVDSKTNLPDVVKFSYLKGV